MTPVLTFMSPCFLLFPNMAAKVVELEDNIQEVYQHSKDNRKETGRLEGIRCLCFAALKAPADT